MDLRGRLARTPGVVTATAGPITAGHVRAPDERRLIAAAADGSSAAVEELYRRHWRPAYRAAYLITRDAPAAEDIAQEALLAALHRLERFDRARPFAPWLHRIVANRALDYARARALRRTAAEGEPAAQDPVPLDDALVTALGALSLEHRAVVVLRYLLDYTPGEIATMLELPRGTINSRLRRALDALAEVVER